MYHFYFTVKNTKITKNEIISFPQNPVNAVSTKVHMLRLLNMGDSNRGHVVFGTKTRTRRERNHVSTVRHLLHLKPPPGGPHREATLHKNQKHRCGEAHKVRGYPQLLSIQIKSALTVVRHPAKKSQKIRLFLR